MSIVPLNHKETTMKNKQHNLNKNMFEGLEFGDMRGLVSKEIHIDRHKPKIGSDDTTVVVALIVNYEDPAKELSNFIESGMLDHLDVEASSAPDTNGTYRVFVEFQRNHNLFDTIKTMLDDLDRITSNAGDKWEYVAYRTNGKVTKFTQENFRRDIVDSASEYRRTYKTNDAIDESIDRIKKLIKY
jgi:hypothetical protein